MVSTHLRDAKSKLVEDISMAVYLHEILKYIRYFVSMKNDLIYLPKENGHMNSTNQTRWTHQYMLVGLSSYISKSGE